MAAVAPVELPSQAGPFRRAERLQFIEGDFLPDYKCTPETKLLYLTRFSRETEICPFTNKQIALFIESAKIAKCTSRCLNGGIWATTLLSTAPVMVFGFPWVATWIKDSPTNTLHLALAAAAVTAVVNLYNFIATGTLPDRSAIANTARENQIEKTMRTYEDLGCRLIELSQENRPLALAIAEQLDVDQIKCRMAAYISEEFAEDHCSYLDHAKYYVLNGHLEADAPLSLRQTVKLIRS